MSIVKIVMQYLKIPKIIIQQIILLNIINSYQKKEYKSKVRDKFNKTNRK